MYLQRANADGSIQYIGLGGDLDSVLAGQTLIASDGKTEHRFTFPSNVVNTSGECDFDPLGIFCATVSYVLVATQGFADLNVVKPDFVVPNGFLLLPSGSVQLGMTEYSYASLPPNGWDEAENNASEYYSFNPNFTGFWWAAPAGSESGWGINFAHQGNTVFATWLTHDASGMPKWLTMIANRTFTKSGLHRNDLRGHALSCGPRRAIWHLRWSARGESRGNRDVELHWR
jgi:hypothetical protein